MLYYIIQVFFDFYTIKEKIMDGNWAWRMLFPYAARRGICAATNAFGSIALWLAFWLLVVWIALTTFAFLRDLKPKKRRKDDKTAGSADMVAEMSEAETAKKNGAETEIILAESFAEDSVGVKPDDGEMRRME